MEDFERMGSIVGEIKWYAGSNIPDGYLICNGSTVSRTTYETLFAVIGTIWGTGDGSTTFTLPNLINRVAWGGSSAGTYKAAGLPNITGAMTWNTMRYKSTFSGAFSQTSATEYSYANYNDSGDGRNVAVSFNASKSNAIYGKSSTVQPPAATLIPIIKY